jgi:hypothetical protein
MFRVPLVALLEPGYSIGKRSGAGWTRRRCRPILRT